MTKQAHERRVLALDLRLERFSFAVLEGAQLLDWGVRKFAVADTALSATVSRRIEPILRFQAPSVALVRQTPRRSHSRKRYRTVIQAITRQFRQRSMAWSFVDRTEIRQAFAQYGDRTRYEIAARVALWFPELTWKLPPEREFYDPEHPNMLIFDAISVAITYFSQPGDMVREDGEMSTVSG